MCAERVTLFVETPARAAFARLVTFSPQPPAPDKDRFVPKAVGRSGLVRLVSDSGQTHRSRAARRFRSMHLPARINLVTLACRDVERMARLFRTLGWVETPES